MDMSNKSLALLLVASLVITLGATVVTLNKFNGLEGTGLTGLVVDSGWAAVNIAGLQGCNVDSTVNYGTGTVTGTTTLSSDANNAGSGFNNCTQTGTVCGGLQVNNTGNANLRINFSSDVNATGFLSGNSVVQADFVYHIYNGTTNSTRTSGGCGNNSGITAWSSWQNVPELQNVTICHNLTFSDGTDVITMEFNTTLRTDTPSGQKNATITVECVQN